MEFFKMSGGGNDFIVIDNRSTIVRPEAIPDLVRRITVRALSVGADGVIFLEPSRIADLRATFFNPDGLTTFCGNGGRCISRLAYLMGLVGPRMRIETIKMVHDAVVEGERVQFLPRDHRLLHHARHLKTARQARAREHEHDAAEHSRCYG
jgi:diaminopimelate epimerase